MPFWSRRKQSETVVENTGQFAERGLRRTDLHCHSCSLDFIAEVDFDLDGPHEIACPHCGHLHYRVIEGGVITSERWDSDGSSCHVVPGQRVWRAPKAAIRTSSGSEFLRELWLNKDR